MADDLKQLKSENRGIAIPCGYFSVSELADKYGYSKDYISWLARSGKIEAFQKGNRNQWFTSELSLKKYQLTLKLTEVGKGYLSLRLLSKKYGYAKDYLGWLARTGKVEAVMASNNQWFIREQSFEKYCFQIVLAKKERSALQNKAPLLPKEAKVLSHESSSNADEVVKEKEELTTRLNTVFKATMLLGGILIFTLFAPGTLIDDTHKTTEEAKASIASSFVKAFATASDSLRNKIINFLGIDMELRYRVITIVNEQKTSPPPSTIIQKIFQPVQASSLNLNTLIIDMDVLSDRVDSLSSDFNLKLSTLDSRFNNIPTLNQVPLVYQLPDTNTKGIGPITLNPTHLVSETLTVSGASALSSTLSVLSDFSVDTNVFKVDTTNNRVGINTSSLDVAFEVSGAASISGNTTFGGTLTVTGNIAIGTTSAPNQLTIIGSGSFTGQLKATRNPTVAHTGTWPSFANTNDSTLYINPSSPVADGNVIAYVSGSNPKFVVDAEGDIYGNSLILTGTTTTGTTTTQGDLTVEGNTQLGDAIGDKIRFVGTILPKTLSSFPLLVKASASQTVDVFRIRDSSDNTLLTLDQGTGLLTASSGFNFGSGSTASVSYSRLGASTTSHSNYMSKFNDLLISGDLEVKGTASFSGVASISGATFLNSIKYTWPSADGSTNQFLRTNGSGTLAWATAGVSSNSLDFDEMVNSMTLDANLRVASAGYIFNLRDTDLTAGNITASSSGNVDFILRSSTTNGVSNNDDAKFTIRTGSSSENFQIRNGANTQLLTIASRSGLFSIKGSLTALTGNNLKLQASGTGTGSTGSRSIYFLDSSGTTRGRVDTAVGTFSATGGTITTDGSYEIHTFTTSGTLTFAGTGSVSYLVVAGGGGGGTGGGGAGGMLTGTGFTVTASAYTITVGGGGTAGAFGASNGGNGVDSKFSTNTATGGGGGANSAVGLNGGSGGGAGANVDDHAGGTGTSGQGSNGGNNTGDCCGGGGGGKGAVGANATVSSGGNGGTGTASSISGSSVTYAGGGGGAATAGNTAGTGGAGGGGNGAVADNGTAGTDNRGGGGGGGYGGGKSGGAGGSGIVVIRFINVTTDYGTLYIGSTNTTSADLAEYYVSHDSSLSAGDVVSVNTDGSGYGLIKSKDPDSPLGIVSTNPGFILGGGEEDKTNQRLVALAGRVPAKVSTENGVIKVGDRLAVSKTDLGIAVKAISSGDIVGIALENFGNGSASASFDINTASGSFGTTASNSVTTSQPIEHGKILVFIKPGYWAPSLAMLPASASFDETLTLKTEEGKGFTLATLFNFIVGQFEKMLHIKFGDGVIETNSVTVHQGVTIYDQDTGNPYCIGVKNGQTITTPGICATSTPTATPEVSESPSPTPEMIPESSPSLSATPTPEATSAPSDTPTPTPEPSPTPPDTPVPEASP